VDITAGIFLLGGNDLTLPQGGDFRCDAEVHREVNYIKVAIQNRKREGLTMSANKQKAKNKTNIKSQSQIELGLDFMGYVGVSGFLPIDLGNGPLDLERIQQLALPAVEKKDDLFKIDDALSDLSWKVRAEVDAGNNPINLQLGGDTPELAELMMGQMTSQEWHQWRNFIQEHWSDAVITEVRSSLSLYDERFQQRGLTAVPKNNVAMRFDCLDGVTFLDFEGVVFVQGSDLFPLFVDDLPQGCEVDDLLKVQTLEGSNSISFGRFMFDQCKVSGDLGDLLYRHPMNATKWLLLRTCPELEILLCATRNVHYGRSLALKWEELISSQSPVYAGSMFKEMDFVNGFPCITSVWPLVVAPMEFKLTH